MAVQIFIGLTTEGKTDHRFLESIVERTFIEVAFECFNDVEPYIRFIDIDKHDLGFNEYIAKTSRKGVEEMGMNVLCVHTDADNDSPDEAYLYKINPAKKHLSSIEDHTLCKILTPVIPVRMIEAWMLADKELFRKEIGTNKSDNELGINRPPEQIATPKTTVMDAITIARKDLPKRRRKELVISDLYLPLGQKLELCKLEKLDSYKLFKEEVRNTYKALHLL